MFPLSHGLRRASSPASGGAFLFVQPLPQSCPRLRGKWPWAVANGRKGNGSRGIQGERQYEIIFHVYNNYENSMNESECAFYKKVAEKLPKVVGLISFEMLFVANIP